MTPERRKGRIVTFYSYKGGTGRSMVLANVAWILASNGLRVLVIDWDLEAPGVHRYFHPFLRDKDLTSSPGIMDCVVAFATAALSPKTEAETESPDEWYRPYANLLEYASSLEWKDFPDAGTVDFVPAGRQDAAYTVRVNSFNWDHFYSRLGGGVFLEAIKEQLREEYDYVLIDSRTGVSDTSGICTVQMPDELVVFFTLNHQSIEGAFGAAASAYSQRRLASGAPGLTIWPVPTRIDQSEKEKLNLAIDAAQQRFEPLLEQLAPDQRDRYWGGVAVPYVPFYAYEELLATFGDKPHQSATMLASCEAISRWLSGDHELHLGRQAEDKRVETYRLFLRQERPAARSSSADYLFYLSYPRNEDTSLVARVYADLSSRLGESGSGGIGYFDPASDDAGAWRPTATGALAASRCGVCLLSPAYLANDLCLEDLHRLRELGKPIIPIVWVPLRAARPPEEIADLRLAPDDASPIYRTQGLRNLMRGRQQLDAYQAAIATIAEEIRAVVFGKAEPARRSVKRLLLVTLAERADRAREFRGNARPYGVRRQDWQPFWSQNGPSSSHIALAASDRLNVPFNLTSLTRFKEWIRQSKHGSREGAILLVDPWTIALPEYADVLHEIDRVTGRECVVIACFDRDGPTRQRAQDLKDRLRRAMPRRSRGETHAPLVIVQSQEELEAALERATRYLERELPSAGV